MHQDFKMQTNFKVCCFSTLQFNVKMRYKSYMQLKKMWTMVGQLQGDFGKQKIKYKP